MTRGPGRRATASSNPASGPTRPTCSGQSGRTWGWPYAALPASRRRCSRVARTGQAQREGWRRFAHGSVVPVARIVARELADKLDAPGLTLSFDALYASDVVGRTRSYKQLVEAGMNAGEAARIAGLA